ncbi:MAG TPA: RdgB/HAM1 family non-canonical purine NTP pyrophosphatase [Phycisphaerae bacterium]|nr:RdgB/HAM1 family non-canonical purine NTP pyrophosphatase [Phycisphaerae bacterium]HOJ73314.1 RdgB/HAM1 family non-canonical purine NTP pyrophosphatase [Phycisphaerae bacterium]HOM51120.1 RdgB/HAM1 family non-canonical purine NTP pyrophosphatase [Phycisphaerae bacterium]HON66083.1 RdgB/HAM1 family non-canonical purine NTP pyrophosphatase [Phycisphaerae bacterium]HOQ86068.1 RdgB/HAM1 family non-canonical purine NTP pyrophosphatase [Phycisphaerae bacterium]
MREILLATGNPGKAKEMREILAGDDDTVVWRHLKEFADRRWPEPVEDGETFMANAELKARYYARLSGLWTIADDSGLVVDALGGEPGVRSARYAGEPKSDAANNALLVRKLAGVPDEKRTARFCCAVALSDGERVLARAQGVVEGRIIDQPRGTNGFGYDPHFWVPEFGMTTAEMAPEQKHAISHRGQALRLLRDELIALLRG